MAYTIKDLLEKTQAFFADKGMASPRLDAEVLLGDALGLSRVQVYAEFLRPLHQDEVAAYRARIKRRVEGESVAHIVGGKEFYGRFIEVNDNVLVPRPETEHLVDEVLQRLEKESTARFLDVGTGSGCISVALLAERKALTAVAIDISQPALNVAERNFSRHGLSERVTLVCSDVFAGLDADARGPVDFIVSNPPYIRRADAETLSAEVQREPEAALFGEDDDGLGMHRRLLTQSAEILAPGGFVILECGYDQAEALAALAPAHLPNASVYKDLAGHRRGVVFSS